MKAQIIFYSKNSLEFFEKNFEKPIQLQVNSHRAPRRHWRAVRAGRHLGLRLGQVWTACR